VFKEGFINEDRSYFEVSDCGNKETPPVPCVITEKWEAGRGQVI